MENIVEIGEIAHFEQFHLFPQCFPKAFFFSVLKRVYMEERVKSLCYTILTFNDSDKTAFGNIRGNGENNGRQDDFLIFP